MSISVHQNKPRRKGPIRLRVYWIVGVGLLLCGCRSPLFTAGVNEPLRKRSSGSEHDSDLTQTPAWKRDFDRFVASHSRQTSLIRQASADLPTAGASGRNRTPTGSVSTGLVSGESVSGESVSGLLNRGHAAVAAGRTAQAQRAYRRVLVDDPDNTVAHHRLAIIADRQQDFDSADYHYHRALRGGRNNPDLLSDLGYSYLLQERYQESEDFLREAVRLSPGHLRAWSNFGLLFAVQGDYDRSLAAFRRSGTERDAQARLAALFPNGRPQGGPAERRSEPAQPRDSVRAPQPVPTGYSQRATGSIEPSAGRSPVSDPGRPPARRGSESLTRQLQDAMQTARQQRRFDQRPLRSPGRVVAAGAGTNFAPRRTTSIPGNRINHAFSDIDHRVPGQSLSALRSTVPSTDSSVTYQPVQQDPGMAGVGQSSTSTARVPTRGDFASPTAGRHPVADNRGQGHPRPSAVFPMDHRRQSTGRSRSASFPVTDAQRNPALSNAPALSGRSNSSAPTGSDPSLLWPPQVFDTDSHTSPGRPRPAVRQTDYSGRSRQNRPVTPWTDEARRAARIGLAAGPGAILPASPVTQFPTTVPRGSSSSVTRFSDTNVRAGASLYHNQTARIPQDRFRGGSPGATTPRRLPRASAERVPASGQVFVPAPNQPTGYQMRSESSHRIDPAPYQPSRRQVSTNSRPRSATVPSQPPRYGYQPAPYQPQRRGVPTGRVDRPRIIPGNSGNGLPTQQGERPFTAPPSNARSVVIPQRFLPR